MSDTETNEIESDRRENKAENKPAVAGLSRDPENYVPSDHFLTRFSPSCGRPDDTRHNPRITSDVVETCIREGELRRANGRNRWILEAKVDDHNWWLVVGIHEGKHNDVLTAYVPGVHETDDELNGGARDDVEHEGEDDEDLSIIDQVRQNIPEYPHRDRGVLQSYVDDGFSAPEIAERLHVHPSTIRNWLDEFDIDAPTQPREERRSGSWHPHDVGDRVVDREQTGEERSPAVVVELPGVAAENCVIDEIGVPVSALNENYPPESQVAMVAFERDLDDNASGWRNVPVDELAERLERTGVKVYAYPLP